MLAQAVASTWRWTPTRLDLPLTWLATAATCSTLRSPWRAAGLEPLLLLVATMLVSVGGAAAYSPRGSRGLALVAVWVAGAIPAAVAGLTRMRLDAGLPAALPALGLNGLGTTMAVATVLALVGAAAVRWPPVAREVRSVASLEANRNRLVLWETAFRIFAAHPVLGTGFGTFQAAYERYRPADAPEPEPPFAHNLLLNFLAETGVVGTAALVTLCATGLAAAWRWATRSPPQSGERAAATAVLAALVTLLVHQMFDGTVLSVHVGFGFFALLALAAVGDGRPQAAGRRSGR